MQRDISTASPFVLRFVHAVHHSSDESLVLSPLKRLGFAGSDSCCAGEVAFQLNWNQFPISPGRLVAVGIPSR